MARVCTVASSLATSAAFQSDTSTSRDELSVKVGAASCTDVGELRKRTYSGTASDSPLLLERAAAKRKCADAIVAQARANAPLAVHRLRPSLETSLARLLS